MYDRRRPWCSIDSEWSVGGKTTTTHEQKKGVLKTCERWNRGRWRPTINEKCVPRENLVVREETKVSGKSFGCGGVVYY